MKKLAVNAVWLVPLVYVMIAIVGPKVTIKGEVFPFFHWGLYSEVPQDISKNDVFIVDKNQNEYRLFTTIEKKVSRVVFYNMLDGFVRHIGTEKESEYLFQLLKHIPSNQMVLIKKISKDKVEILGEINNHFFKSYTNE